MENVEKGQSSRPNLLSSRFKKCKSGSGSGFTIVPLECDKYLNEVCEEKTGDFHILNWWKANCHPFPILSSMARDVLAILVFIVVSESAFSTRDRVLDSFRSYLSLKMVESLICTQDWLRSSTTSMSVEEGLDHVEQLEEELAKVTVDSPSLVEI